MTKYGKLQREIAAADQKAVEAQLRGDSHAFGEWRAIGDALRDGITSNRPGRAGEDAAAIRAGMQPEDVYFDGADDATPAPSDYPNLGYLP